MLAISEYLIAIVAPLLLLLLLLLLPPVAFLDAAVLTPAPAPAPETEDPATYADNKLKIFVGSLSFIGILNVTPEI
jgi:hypothetical protein